MFGDLGGVGRNLPTGQGSRQSPPRSLGEIIDRPIATRLGALKDQHLAVAIAGRQIFADEITANVALPVGDWPLHRLVGHRGEILPLPGLADDLAEN